MTVLRRQEFMEGGVRWARPGVRGVLGIDDVMEFHGNSVDLLIKEFAITRDDYCTVSDPYC